MATGLVEPALGLHTVSVGEHPHPIKVTVEVVGQPIWWLGELSSEAELLDGAWAAVGADDGQHQRVPVEPWSAIG